MAAVRLDGLVRRFGERTALDGVSLELPERATLAVLGPNGAGKSTLLRVLAGLLRPHGGTVEVLGRALPRDGWAVRGRVGFLGHEPLLFGDLTVRDNLRYHARLHRVPLARIDAVLERTGLTARAGDRVHELSRGLVQRAAACRALLHEPELLLLDEPRANLDPAAAAALDELLAGRTRVITSHDVRGALAEADLVLGLRGGRPALAGAAADVRPEQVEELYA
jgi:heme exporter protein A